MCGRFALTTMPGDLIEEFEITAGYSGLPLPSDWNVTPTRQIYAIRDNASHQRELTTLSWGMIAPWSKDSTEALRSQSMAINARSESVHEKPTFRNAFRSRRCLIPVSGYYEWATELGKYETKQPFFIHSTLPSTNLLKPVAGELTGSESNSKSVNRSPFKTLALAGIWDQWVDDRGEVHESASIITREAVGFLATVHHRMPTFLPADRWDAWLNPDLKNVEEIRNLMNFEIANPTIAAPDANLAAYPVATLVNSIRNNGPELIKEIELGESQTLF